MVVRSRATTCTADRSRRRGGGCPIVRGTFREEGSMNTHTIDEVREGSLPPREAQWERQDGAPAYAVAELGQGQRRSPGNRPARGGTTPPAQQGSISPTKPAQRPSATTRSEPPPRARAAPSARRDDDNNHPHREEVARAPPVLLSSGRRVEEEIGTSASCTSAALGLAPSTALCRELHMPPVGRPEEETSPLPPRKQLVLTPDEAP